MRPNLANVGPKSAKCSLSGELERETIMERRLSNGAHIYRLSGTSRCGEFEGLRARRVVAWGSGRGLSMLLAGRGRGRQKDASEEDPPRGSPLLTVLLTAAEVALLSIQLRLDPSGAHRPDLSSFRATNKQILVQIRLPCACACQCTQCRRPPPCAPPSKIRTAAVQAPSGDPACPMVGRPEGGASSLARSQDRSVHHVRRQCMWTNRRPTSSRN